MQLYLSVVRAGCRHCLAGSWSAVLCRMRTFADTAATIVRDVISGTRTLTDATSGCRLVARGGELAEFFRSLSDAFVGWRRTLRRVVGALENHFRWMVGRSDNLRHIRCLHVATAVLSRYVKGTAWYQRHCFGGMRSNLKAHSKNIARDTQPIRNKNIWIRENTKNTENLNVH